MNRALLIVDMQIMPFIWKDYGGKSLYNENLLLENARSLINKARKSATPIYYIHFTEGEGSLRAKGEPLWKVHPQIAPQEGDREIIKYYADSFLETELHTLLQKDGVDTIVVCGVQTEYCVDTTVKSAYSHGYHVILANDCHSTYESELLPAQVIIAHHNTILAQFADIVPSKKIDL
jgi:nicotinamidase-related amidase